MEKIEVCARVVKGASCVPFVGDVYHLFIIYTDDKNDKFIIRGGPENGHELYDNILVIKSPYIKQFRHLFSNDFVENAPSVVIAQGSDSKALFDKMWNIAQGINSGHYDYKIPIPYCPLELCHVQNGNTIVKVLVESVGLQLKIPQTQINNKPVWDTAPLVVVVLMGFFVIYVLKRLVQFKGRPTNEE